MPCGYTMVWSGWDFAVGTSTANFNSINGAAITGPAFEYIVTTGTSFILSYPAATLDQNEALPWSKNAKEIAATVIDGDHDGGRN